MVHSTDNTVIKNKDGKILKIAQQYSKFHRKTTLTERVFTKLKRFWEGLSNKVRSYFYDKKKNNKLNAQDAQVIRYLDPMDKHILRALSRKNLTYLELAKTFGLKENYNPLSLRKVLRLVDDGFLFYHGDRPITVELKQNYSTLETDRFSITDKGFERYINETSDAVEEI